MNKLLSKYHDFEANNFHFMLTKKFIHRAIESQVRPWEKFFWAGFTHHSSLPCHSSPRTQPIPFLCCMPYPGGGNNSLWLLLSFSCCHLSSRRYQAVSLSLCILISHHRLMVRPGLWMEQTVNSGVGGGGQQLPPPPHSQAAPAFFSTTCEAWVPWVGLEVPVLFRKSRLKALGCSGSEGWSPLEEVQLAGLMLCTRLASGMRQRQRSGDLEGAEGMERGVDRESKRESSGPGGGNGKREKERGEGSSRQVAAWSRRRNRVSGMKEKKVGEKEWAWEKGKAQQGGMVALGTQMLKPVLLMEDGTE